MYSAGLNNVNGPGPVRGARETRSRRQRKEAQAEPWVAARSWFASPTAVVKMSDLHDVSLDSATRLGPGCHRSDSAGS